MFQGSERLIQRVTNIAPGAILHGPGLALQQATGCKG
jgi:hypothetical protein